MTEDNGRETTAERMQRMVEQADSDLALVRAEPVNEREREPAEEDLVASGINGVPDAETDVETGTGVEYDEADEAQWDDVETHLATLQETLVPLCQSKAEELALWGYEQVDPQVIWDLVAEEARKSGALHLHQVANAILTLKPNRIMDHLMKALYRRGDVD